MPSSTCCAAFERCANNRYGEPRLCKPGSDQQFAQLFEAHASSQFLEDQLHVLHPLASGHYLSPRVVNLALQYLTRALELKGTYKQMKPHVEPLLSQVRGDAGV
jgi:hypothetical protein